MCVNVFDRELYIPKRFMCVCVEINIYPNARVNKMVLISTVLL